MNMHQVVQPGSSSNGYDRKIEKDFTTRVDNKFKSGKSNPGRIGYGKGGGIEIPSRDRLIYLTTCLVGHQVEVQVRDGSVFSGIFHATNADDFGIVLKMAHMIKDGVRGDKSMSGSLGERPSKTLIIPSEDFVQVIAKGVSVTKDGSTKELQNDMKRELMTDACISGFRHVDIGRELQPWVPDEDDQSRPELENIFNDHGNRGWDQFQANESLFGVKSTFNEEFYTTKLEKGPRTRELERKAMKMAREIEHEETLDPHLAEERGIYLDANLEMDEEARFSSVCRIADDCGVDETENVTMDSKNDETFGFYSDSSAEKSLANREVQSTFIASSSDFHLAVEDHGDQSPKIHSRHSSVIDANRHHENEFIKCSREDKEKQTVVEQNRVSKAEDSHLILGQKIDSSDKVGLSPNAIAYDPSHEPTRCQDKTGTSDVVSEGYLPPKTQGTTISPGRPSSSASSTSDRRGTASTSAGRGMSPSSSAGSLSSERSTLNPHAKEFKLNPNAKSFIPYLTTPRPPVSDSSFYYPGNITAMQHMHGMPASFGVGAPFIQSQPVIFNPQVASMPPPYYHATGSQYGQQVMGGQHRPVFYMPPAPSPDVSYKRREF